MIVLVEFRVQLLLLLLLLLSTTTAALGDGVATSSTRSTTESDLLGSSAEIFKENKKLRPNKNQNRDQHQHQQLQNQQRRQSQRSRRFLGVREQQCKLVCKLQQDRCKLSCLDRRKNQPKRQACKNRCTGKYV